jgi:hypothetical protein
MARTHRGKQCCTIARGLLLSRGSRTDKTRTGLPTHVVFVADAKRRKIFVIVTANSKNITKANPLHHLQMPAGAGLTVSGSGPIIHNMRRRIELLRSSRSRSLSIGDHSWTDPLRKTTTTPTNPASATPICAAMPRASPVSMIG